MEISGVKVDLPKLRQTFVTEKPDLLPGVNKAAMAIRYRQFPQALAELEKLATAAGLTEPQKKVINDVTEQIKQLIAQAPAKAAQ